MTMKNRDQPDGDLRHRLLRSSAFFNCAGDDEIRRLADRASWRTARAGELIFGQGGEAHWLGLIAEGLVRISITSGSGRPVVLNVNGPGDILGELAILDAGNRTADATAVIPCRLLTLARVHVVSYLERHPRACLDLLAFIVARVRRATTMIEQQSAMPLATRLARSILGLLNQSIDEQIVLSQAALAEIVLASRESTNRQLKEWEREGTLGLSRRRIIVRKRSTLERHARDPGLF